MANKLKLGVIGAGKIGKFHTENIIRFIPEALIEGIADINLSTEKEIWAKQLGARIVTAEPHDLLKDTAIEAVLVCSINDTHADMIIAAAKAGKHIFCEKPVDLSIQKAKTAIEVVKKAGVKLQIGFDRRFDHNFARMRERVLLGEIGQVQVVKITSRDPAPPPLAYVKNSGGLFMDMMIHDFDMARFHSGSEITEVFASGAVLVDPEIGRAGDIDTALVTLQFANGALGIIDNCRKTTYGYDQRVEVFGAKGVVIAENDLPNTVKLYNEVGITGEKPLYFYMERYKNAFIDELTAFVDAVKNNRNIAVSGEDGLAAICAAFAAAKSFKEKRVVSIEEIHS
jgi:myo-inositol 2-dehydrogenase/D-chiro-inositol 1-dehydrogenase